MTSSPIDADRPMPALDTIQHRNPQTSVVDRRRANGTLKPFIGELQRWNGKAARLRGLVESFYSTEEDRNWHASMP